MALTSRAPKAEKEIILIWALRLTGNQRKSSASELETDSQTVGQYDTNSSDNTNHYLIIIRSLPGLGDCQTSLFRILKLRF